MENSTETLHEERSDKEKSLRQHTNSLWDISNNIQGYSLMFMIPLGIVFNLLTVFTFLKIKYYKTSTGLNLLCLACSEFLLLVGFAMSSQWPYHINFTYSGFCIMRNFILLSQQIWSGFLMVCITVEKYLAVAFPLKFKTWNIKKISKISISVFGILSCIFGGLSASRMILIKSGDHNKCKHNPNFDELNSFFQQS